MEKKLRILTVTYSPGRHGASIDVQPVLIDDDGVTETPLGARETVETNQPDLQSGKGNWGDTDVVRVVTEAEKEVEPAVDEVKDNDGEVVVAAKPAVKAPRFAGMEIVAE